MENTKKYKKYKQGFTLLELLVVVLIIGILAGIALPKYVTAVKVSKVRTALGVVKSIHDARNRYYLLYNKYTADLDELDIDIPYTNKKDEGSRIQYTVNWGKFYVYKNSILIVVNVKVPVITIDYYGHGRGAYYALCYSNEKICSKFGGEIKTPKEQHSSGTNVYYMTKI